MQFSIYNLTDFLFSHTFSSPFSSPIPYFISDRHIYRFYVHFLKLSEMLLSYIFTCLLWCSFLLFTLFFFLREIKTGDTMWVSFDPLHSQMSLWTAQSHYWFWNSVETQRVSKAVCSICSLEFYKNAWSILNFRWLCKGLDKI